jgi:hypothetical protein
MASCLVVGPLLLHLERPGVLAALLAGTELLIRLAVVVVQGTVVQGTVVASGQW